tara:strand:+ start:3009 stop:3413 length:405 start_codon:yes stop_codon:yes gene_type:complete
MTTEAALCVHHWIIDTAQGPLSKGYCKKCGEVQEFKNHIVESVWHDKSAIEEAERRNPPGDETPYLSKSSIVDKFADKKRRTRDRHRAIAAMYHESEEGLLWRRTEDVARYFEVSPSTVKLALVRVERDKLRET